VVPADRRLRALLKLLDRVGVDDVPRVEAAIAQRRRELEEQIVRAEGGTWPAAASAIQTARSRKEPLRGARHGVYRTDFDETAISLTDLGGS
jgi:hypothetical protein